MRVPSNYLDSLASLGALADLEFDIRLIVRRGIVRAIICTASSPLDSPAERHPCGYSFEKVRDTIEVIQALCIESAVRWREPQLPDMAPPPVAWFDSTVLGLRPAGRP